MTKLVEDKANGPAVVQSLKHEITGLIEVQPEAGKVSRAAWASPQLENRPDLFATTIGWGAERHGDALNVDTVNIAGGAQRPEQPGPPGTRFGWRCGGGAAAVYTAPW